MAGSSIVGILKILLTADTSDLKGGFGEASKVTKQFSGEMKGMATEVSSLSKAFGAMFTVGALTAAAAKVLDYAGKVSDLAEKTGLTTDSIQEMGHAAKQSGTSLEGFTNAAFKLGVNLEEGTAKVIGATERLGISYDALLKMSPDDQFKAIADALKQVEDVQERNRLGVILMGRTYAQVAGAINEGYADLARNASVSSAEQIEALRKAGDEWDVFSGKVMNLGVIIGGSFAKSMSQLGTALKQDWEFIQRHTLDRVTQAIEDWKTIFGKLGTVPPPPSGPRKDLPAPIRPLTMDAAELAKVEADLTKQGKELIEVNKRLQKSAEEFAESLKKLGGADALSGAREVRKQLEALGGPLKVMPDQLEEMADRLREGAQAALLMGDADLAAELTAIAKSLEPIAVFQAKWNVKIGEYVTLAPQAVGWTEELNEQLQRLGGTVTKILPTLQSSMDLSKLFVPFKGIVKQNLPSENEWAGAWGAMKDGLKIALAQIPGTLARAFEGGGNIWGAIKSIGSQIGSIIGASFGTSETGKAIGAAIGSLVGPLMQGFKKLFGIGINDEIKKFNKEIDKSREALLKQFGSLERIARLGKAVGVDLAGAWHHQGEAGLKAFKELAEEFERRVAEMEADLEGFKGDLDDVIDEARDMGYIFDRAGNLVSVRFQKMQELAGEFGVDLQALGPAFQNARIQDQAAKIVNAFELLSKGGTDAGTILFGLKDEISALVNDSIKFGTTVPQNMRPWIEELIRSGQLLDDNGDAITDIGQIQFGATIETQFERISNKIIELISKIDELINTLLRELTPALDEATRDRNVHIGFTTDPLPDLAGLGMGQQGFATGTMGSLGKWFGDFKTGMPAMLHGMEAVVTPNQAVPFALDVLGANAGFAQSQQRAAPTPPIQVRSVVENRMFMDGHELKRWILEAVTVAIENNERGIRSRQRDALGIV